MQVSRVNYGYDTKKQHTQSFKSRVEQRQFMTIVNNGLTEAAQKSLRDKNGEALRAHFATAFEKVAEFFKLKGFEVKFDNSNEEKYFSVTNRLDGMQEVEDEVISVSMPKDGRELIYTERQYLESNPHRTSVLSRIFTNIIYKADAETPNADGNKLVSRTYRRGLQDIDDRTTDGNLRYGSSASNYFTEYLVTKPGHPEHGFFGYRTDLKVEKPQ